MLYLETKPSCSLSGFIRSLWYVRAPAVAHQRERVLPNGCIQIVISLASDTLTDCDHHTSTTIPAAILVGARTHYEIIATKDLAELVGIVFRPGGMAPWLRHPATDLFEKSVTLEDAWKPTNLRDRLREATTPAHKLSLLDAFLADSLRGRQIEQRTIVKAALHALRSNTVKESAQSLSISERRLHQVFTEDVGLSPKQWSRIHRFQRAVHDLHSGNDLRWEQLALACGYYDQAHFSNDFHGFSGIDPTTYSLHRGPWRNHVAME